MIRIRLIKIGRKNDSYYRIIVSPKGTPPRGGRFLEILGYYSPRVKTFSIEKERVLYWLSQGAKCSDTVHNLLVREEVIKEAKRKIKMPKPMVKQTEQSVAEVAVEKEKIKEEKSVEEIKA